MKRFVALLMALLLITASATADTITIDLSTATDAELMATKDTIMLELASRAPIDSNALLTCKVKNHTVSVTSIRHSSGRNAESGVALTFSFTNGSHDTTSFQLTAWVTVYQDGVECKSIWVDGTDSTSRSVKVQPGATYSGANWGFAIPNPDGIIEVQICDASNARRPVIASVFIDLSTID